jgi:hypothetical protein
MRFRETLRYAIPNPGVVRSNRAGGIYIPFLNRGLSTSLCRAAGPLRPFHLPFTHHYAVTRVDEPRTAAARSSIALVCSFGNQCW